MSTPNIPLTLNCDALPISASVNDILIKYVSALAEIQRLLSEVERLRSDRDCEKRLRKDAEEFRENAIARAERAEAEIIRLRTENSDLKATDTRPLLTGTLTHAGFCRIGEEQLDGVFISIDREQIKALRHLPMYQQIELRMAAMKEGAK